MKIKNLCWPAHTGLLIIERKEAHWFLHSTLLSPWGHFPTTVKERSINRSSRFTGWKKQRPACKVVGETGFGRKSTGDGELSSPKSMQRHSPGSLADCFWNGWCTSGKMVPNADLVLLPFLWILAPYRALTTLQCLQIWSFFFFYFGLLFYLFSGSWFKVTLSTIARSRILSFCKIFWKENFKDLNKWRDISCSWIRTRIVEMIQFSPK